MSFTDYQAKYYAHELTRRFPPDSIEKVTAAFAGAQVDLNPHQIDAAFFAIAGALAAISKRLKAKLRKEEPDESLSEELDEDYEALDSTAEEWGEDEQPEKLSEADRKATEQEITDLDAFTQLATSIEHNAKGLALLKALKIAFTKAAEIGAAQKTVIFTESRHTQDYLLRLLADSPFAEGIALFNGSNTDEHQADLCELV